MDRGRMDVSHELLPFIGNVEICKSGVKIRLRIAFPNNEENMRWLLDFRTFRFMAESFYDLVKRIDTTATGLDKRFDKA